MYRSSEKKKFVLCGYYVLIKREIAVGLIHSVKTPPSPQKNWEESPSSPLFLKRGGSLYKLNNAESPKGDQEILNQHLGQPPYCFSRDGYIHSKQQIRNNMISFCDSHFFGHLIDKRNECSISRTNF